MSPPRAPSSRRDPSERLLGPRSLISHLQEHPEVPLSNVVASKAHREVHGEGVRPRVGGVERGRLVVGGERLGRLLLPLEHPSHDERDVERSRVDPRRFVHLPMGRLAEAEEVAAAALFLASEESSYVNGTAFLVDGGISGAYVTAE